MLLIIFYKASMDFLMTNVVQKSNEIKRNKKHI